MNIATILFTYSRSEHTKKVLDALSKNTVLPSKLFIFQDGLKNSKNEKEWKKVNEIINEVDFCDTEVIVSSKNRGLANSLSEGITEVLSRYDAAIVLEDDCVPMPLFMEYMISNLKEYEKNKKVFQISGWTPQIEIAQNGSDVFFAGRAESWGWATWKDRWDYFSRDYTILGRIKMNEELNEQFNIWGQDLECYLLGNVYGKCDSWATFWALNIIENRGVCVYPYKNLIYNIGFDGTGVHCENREIYGRELCEDTNKRFTLQKSIEISAECKKEFHRVYKWYSSEFRNGYYNKLSQKWLQCKINGYGLKEILRQRNVKSISIWGTGAIFNLIIADISESIPIVNVIETVPSKNSYNGFSICGPNEINEDVEAIIVIPGFDCEYIRECAPLQCRDKVIALEELLATEYISDL